MINRYLVPCRYCGGTVQPDAGTVEKVGQFWLGAHVSCALENQHRLTLLATSSQTVPRRRTSRAAYRPARPF